MCTVGELSILDEVNPLCLFTLVAVLSCSRQGFAVEPASRAYFFFKKTPAFRFAYRQRRDWRVEPYSATSLRFNPSDKVTARYEVPPSIDVVLPDRIRPEDVTITGAQTRTTRGVPYTPIFVKGFERKGYAFEQGNQKIFVLRVDSDPQAGLDAADVDALLLESFEFLDKSRLTADQLRDLIEASPLAARLHEAQGLSKQPLVLDISSQPDMYVVSPKGFRGGPVFQIASDTLEVTLLPVR